MDRLDLGTIWFGDQVTVSRGVNTLCNASRGLLAGISKVIDHLNFEFLEAAGPKT